MKRLDMGEGDSLGLLRDRKPEIMLSKKPENCREARGLRGEGKAGGLIVTQVFVHK